MVNKKFNISAQYFIYFFILGIFLPYFNLYCHKIGFTSFQIGSVSSLKTFSTIVFPLLWGYLADKFFIRKKIFILANFFSAALWFLFFISEKFWFMMGVMFFYSLFQAPIISFLEAFTIDILEKEKAGYGKIRLWGSIGFIISVFLVGYLTDKISIYIILYMIFAGSFIQFLFSIKIPDVSSGSLKSAGFEIKFLLRADIIIFLAASFLMLASHSPYYAFFSIYLSDNGMDNTFIGISWGIAVCAEIFIMYKSDYIFKKINPGKVLVFSMIAAGIRWFILYFFHSGIIILSSQILHCFSYGTFHMASILFIDKMTPAGKKTTGQAVNNAFTYGLGLMAGNLLSGYFYDYYGGRNLFMFAGITAIAGAVLMYVSALLSKLRGRYFL
ncbi:MAG: MFS transporter [Deltaproteobacteria bacterium]|nr:MAG: MFS transporter [Deltaproteobacteria bacterium]